MPSLIASFGGYMPILYKAAVHIPAIEQLLGTDTNTTIRLYEPYVTGRSRSACRRVRRDRQGYRRLRCVADRLPVAFTADKAGGIATPNLNLSNLSRAHGPLAGIAAKAAQDAFDANDFFGGLSRRSHPETVRRHQADRPLADRRRRIGRQERAEDAVHHRRGRRQDPRRQIRLDAECPEAVDVPA